MGALRLLASEVGHGRVRKYEDDRRRRIPVRTKRHETLGDKKKYAAYRGFGRVLINDEFSEHKEYDS